MRHIIIECEGEIYHFYTSSDETAIGAPKPLTESKHGNVGQYTYRIDSPHDSVNGQHHVHFMQKGKDLFALNKDGSAHDGCHGVRINNKILDALPKIMPGITVPKDGIIESHYKKCDSEEEIILFGEFRKATAIID